MRIFSLDLSIKQEKYCAVTNNPPMKGNIRGAHRWGKEGEGGMGAPGQHNGDAEDNLEIDRSIEYSANLKINFGLRDRIH